MVKKTVPALLLLGLSALAIFGGALVMLLVMTIVAAAAAGEMYRVLRAPDVLPAATAGHVAIVGLSVTGYARAARAPGLFPFVVAAALFLSFVVMLVRRDRTNVTRAVASTILPVIAIGVPAAYVVAMRCARGGYTIAWVFVLMALLAEAGASAGTWLVRRRALTPRARRTWEHLGGALVGAAIAAVIAVAAASPPFTWLRALVVALAVAATITTGDLAWSALEDDLARAQPGVKRRRAVVAPRVGGVLLAAPVFFYVLRAIMS